MESDTNKGYGENFHFKAEIADGILKWEGQEL